MKRIRLGTKEIFAVSKRLSFPYYYGIWATLGGPWEIASQPGLLSEAVWMGTGNENRYPTAWPDLNFLGGHNLLRAHGLCPCLGENLGSTAIWKKGPLSLASVTVQESESDT